MQHDLFGSGHDLDLRSNFEIDFSRSNYTSVKADFHEKHDGIKTSSISFSDKMLLAKTFFLILSFFKFYDLWSEIFCSEVKSDDLLAIENFKRNRKP